MAISSSITCLVSIARLWYFRRLSISRSLNFFSWTTLLRVLDRTSSRSNRSISSIAKFLVGILRMSLRSSSDSGRMFGRSTPASARMSVTPAEMIALSWICFRAEVLLSSLCVLSTVVNFTSTARIAVKNAISSCSSAASSSVARSEYARVTDAITSRNCSVSTREFSMRHGQP